MSKQILKKGDHTYLSNLKIGQRAKVLGLHLDKPEVRRHLLDMGITKGVEIFVRKVAPLGDPIEVNVRGYELTIRKSEAENIDVE